MKKMKEDEGLYGILQERNINEVQFGCEKRFSTWYGSNVYFDNENKLIDYKEHKLSALKKQQLNNSVSEAIASTGENANDNYWLDVIYVCEYCFKYCDSSEKLICHIMFCPFREKVPGRIKYLGPKYQIRRVKGAKHTLFCQCLCLFTKLFLDNKSMYFKIENYEFYIIYENNSTKPMGFFSKDIVSYNQNNLACILVFPPYQKKKLGTILIELSYKISKYEGIISSPELPLSPFGLITYINFWSNRICWELLEGELANFGSVSIEDISTVTGFRIQDIIQTLEYLDCLDEFGNIHISKMVEKISTKYGKVTDFIIQDEHLLLND